MLATLRIENQSREESYVSLEAEHSCPFVGCARTKRQYPTVLQNLKSFLWMLDCVDGLPALDLFWNVVIEVLRSTNNTKNQLDYLQETGAGQETIRTMKPRTQHHLAQSLKTETEKEAAEMLINCQMWTTCAQTHSSQGESQLYIIEDNEAVIKMIIKGRFPTMRHMSRTHRVALDGLFDRILQNQKSKLNMLTPKTTSLTCWPKEVSRVMSGIMFFVCSTSWISRFSPAAISEISLWSNQEAECHVKERTRSDFQWRFTDGRNQSQWIGDGDVETHESGDAQPVECEEEPSARLEQASEFKECRNHQETDAEPKPRSNRRFSSESTGKHSKCRLLETGRQGWISEFDEHQDTGAGDEHKEGLMSMFNDIDWTRKRWYLYFAFRKGQDEREEILARPLDVSRSWRRKEVCGKAKYFPEGKWNSVASQMVLRVKETCHPVFPSASALSRGILRTLKGTETVHFKADASNIELLFRIIHFENQLSMYGAVSNWCEQFGLIVDEKGQERILEKGRIREHRNTEEREWCPLQDWHLETDWGNIFKTSNHCPRLFKSQRFADSRHSGTGHRLVWETRLNLSRTTVLEIPSHYAENIHFLEQTHNPEFMDQFMEKQYWTSHWSSRRSHTMPAKMITYRFFVLRAWLPNFSKKLPTGFLPWGHHFPVR